MGGACADDKPAENPFATHNAVVLLGFFFSFLSAYALAQYLTQSRGPALLCAIAYAFCPFVFARMAHVQLLMTFGIPLSLFTMHRLVDRPTIGRATGLAAALVAQALACAYYGIFAGLMVGCDVLYYAAWRRLWTNTKYVTAVAFAAALTVIVLLPFLVPYLSVQANFGFARTLDEAQTFSASWQAWLASSAHAHGWLRTRIVAWNEVLFPGALTYHTIPVFSFLRAPARFGIIVALALSVLLAITARALLACARPRVATLAVTACAAALVLELSAAPLAFVEAAEPDPAYRLLATLPRGPLVEMPFFSRRSDFSRHADYMLNSTYHWQPLINGYSDHIPMDFRRMVDPLNSFPSAEAFRLLRARQTRYVAVHWNYYDRPSAVRVREGLGIYKDHLAPLSQTSNVWLFEITSWPAP